MGDESRNHRRGPSTGGHVATNTDSHERYGAAEFAEISVCAASSRSSMASGPTRTKKHASKAELVGSSWGKFLCELSRHGMVTDPTVDEYKDGRLCLRG